MLSAGQNLDSFGMGKLRLVLPGMCRTAAIEVTLNRVLSSTMEGCRLFQRGLPKGVKVVTTRALDRILREH